MDKFFYNTLLLDYYGDLLTPNQRGVFDGYYAQNLSLGELAENLSVTRQSVNGTLRRVERLLAGYESALGLIAAAERRAAAAAALKAALADKFGSLPEEASRLIDSLKE